MIWLSIRRLLQIVPPDRNEPLPRNEVEYVAQDLNVIYINTRGILDNLAWAAVEQFTVAADRPRGNGDVGLFRPLMRKLPTLEPLGLTLAPYRGWDREFASRRDPAAHRIPLTVPPAVLDESAQLEFAERQLECNQIANEMIRAAKEGRDLTDLAEQREAAFERLERVGGFNPWFTHHPDEGPIPIYPTVPEDVATMIKAAARVFEFFNASVT